MGIFDRFKKKEPDYDTTNLRVTDLDLNFVFDYDLSTWQVTAVYEYDWGDNFFTREYKITDGVNTYFLNVEEDDEIELSLTQKVNVIALGEDIPDQIAKHKKPPQKIEYEGTMYFLEAESPGYFSDVYAEKETWIEFISWDYIDKSGDQILCIEQWEEHRFEAAHGKKIKEFEISNINPHNS